MQPTIVSYDAYNDQYLLSDGTTVDATTYDALNAATAASNSGSAAPAGVTGGNANVSANTPGVGSVLEGLFNKTLSAVAPIATAAATNAVSQAAKAGNTVTPTPGTGTAAAAGTFMGMPMKTVLIIGGILLAAVLILPKLLKKGK